MGVINVLSKQVAELIAAGEVIERPSSVIKELVENAIDADSTDITVEIQHGGVTFMRVTDNGVGIERDDVKNAFLRHATSKISEQDDLDSISDTILSEFSRLKQKNYEIYLADAKSYAEEQARRDKQFNSLLFKMRKGLSAK